MKRMLMGIVLLIGMLSAFWLARGAVPAAVPQAAPAAARFVPVDVYLDTGAKHLGAYQVEVIAKDAKIVGLEGGEPGAFNKPPFYDPAALARGAAGGAVGGGAGGGGDKIVVAAFSTDDNLPTGLTRVARLHFLWNGSDAAATIPNMTSRLVVATDAQGQTVEAKLSLRPMQGDTR